MLLPLSVACNRIGFLLGTAFLACTLGPLALFAGRDYRHFFAPNAIVLNPHSGWGSRRYVCAVQVIISNRRSLPFPIRTGFSSSRGEIHRGRVAISWTKKLGSTDSPFDYS